MGLRYREPIIISFQPVCFNYEQVDSACGLFFFGMDGCLVFEWKMDGCLVFEWKMDGCLVFEWKMDGCLISVWMDLVKAVTPRQERLNYIHPFQHIHKYFRSSMQQHIILYNSWLLFNDLFVCVRSDFREVLGLEVFEVHSQPILVKLRVASHLDQPATKLVHCSHLYGLTGLLLSSLGGGGGRKGTNRESKDYYASRVK